MKMNNDWNLKDKKLIYDYSPGEFAPSVKKNHHDFTEIGPPLGCVIYLKEDIETLRKLLISDFCDLLEPIEGFMGVTPKEAIFIINERFGIKDD